MSFKKCEARVYIFFDQYVKFCAPSLVVMYKMTKMLLLYPNTILLKHRETTKIQSEEVCIILTWYNRPQLFQTLPEHGPQKQDFSKMCQIQRKNWLIPSPMQNHLNNLALSFFLDKIVLKLAPSIFIYKYQRQPQANCDVNRFHIMR